MDAAAAPRTRRNCPARGHQRPLTKVWRHAPQAERGGAHEHVVETVQRRRVDGDALRGGVPVLEGRAQRAAAADVEERPDAH